MKPHRFAKRPGRTVAARYPLLVVAALLGVSAWADPPTPDTQVGDTVTNPSTGESEVVEHLIEDENDVVTYVVTTEGNLILTKYDVDDVIGCVLEPDNEGVCDEYLVVAVTVNEDTGFVDVVELQLIVEEPDPENPEPLVLRDVVHDQAQELADAEAENPIIEGDPEVIPEPITAGVIEEIYRGRNGDSGRNAYGVRICFPLIGCATIGRSGSDGQDGATGPTIDRTVLESHGAITSVEEGVDGIKLVSVGGDGGSGGNAYTLGGLGPYDGGDGGAGGQINLDTRVDITTTMDDAHGISVLSRSGRGGDGGDSFGSGGGGGGSARTGGEINVTNAGDINTFGQVSHGIYALSVGGSAGSGGDGWGIVGAAGSGAAGGHGGNVTITNHGLIHTRGDDAHALFGQSIGGTGGNAGDAGGIVALGGGASDGGRGGNVTVNLGAAAELITEGSRAYGVFGQSVGGGGGDSGGSGGIVSLGASGGAGSHGGDVTVNTMVGSRITTFGAASHAVFAQSVGGGGGASGGAGGLVTIGGSGSSGGAGGAVSVISGAVIDTGGDDARGIFAQSVGAGGGAAGGTGGLVSLGGSGAAGGSGGSVDVANEAGGSITTAGVGADAIFAQSVGGGGGAGAASGGLVSLGGSGSSGGSGGDVSVVNAGTLQTEGALARGVFAQSIGGGGGSGGDSGGLAGIGGGGSSTSGAGDVQVSNTGAISTEGNRATAVFAQSVGGGGGDGGSSDSVITIGGTGGGGGSAGTVTVNQSGTIATAGDDALGIFAEAIGGGGGSGGSAFSASGAAGTVIGGGGGQGGDGAALTIALDDFHDDGTPVPSMIITGGERSPGILAQSVGGGGGSGGAVVQGSGSTFASVSTAVGGTGGDGGDGGTVHLNGSGNVATGGSNATGILLQSVGGGGGNGATTVAAAAQIGIGGVSTATTVGASGGGGGVGGQVLADFDGRIETSGDLSSGLVAQSVGGGGGNGGTTVGAAASAGLFASGAVSTAIGGDGGLGGGGGAVDVTLGSSGTSEVRTSGAQSTGVLVQSVGGGGGNGGLTIAGSASGGGGASGAVSTAIGGSGGGGGAGGDVTADVATHIFTSGDASAGLVVQSVGGGGGNGGLSIGASVSGAGGGSLAVSTAIGGSGDVGGDGGAVVATIGSAERNTVATGGDQSTAILVQSVGGGGGNGGVTVAASLSIAGGVSGAVSTAIGGSGEGGGDGGQVDAVIASNVLTEGDGSGGVIVQSIGGGGGNGGLTNGAAVSGGGGGSLAVSTAIGGDGGVGGDGDIVTADFDGNIETRGGNATGLLAQSVGGGGGNGGGAISATLSAAGAGSGAISTGIGGNGDAGGDGGTAGTDLVVTLTADGTIVTRGDHSAGIVAQSIGGGGGNGGYSITAAGSVAGAGSGSVSVGIGGGGSSGGLGKGVDATSNADIVTLGNDSSGFVAQSIGGGGGNGGYSISGSVSISGVGGGSVGAGVGGSGGGGSDAGAVAAHSTGTIDTTGARSIGFLAQSIGGGGGNGGFNITSSASGAGIGSGTVSGGVGGSGAAGGDGSTVNATSGGDVVTLGDGSTGILAQSVGGGGGNGGYNIIAGLDVAGVGGGVVSAGVGGEGAGGGDGDTVTLAVANDVSTAGSNAAAVIAQSIGGGGGNGGFNITAGVSGAGVGSGAVGVGVGGLGGGGGAGGEVTSSVAGAISTAGENSMGVLVQSVGGGGGNGGMALAAAVSIAGVGSGAGGVGVGGFGGDGGDGGAVLASTSGSVATLGSDASAVVAQSIGGGGGNGGLSVTGTLAGAGVGTGAGSVGLGGFAGGGGNASAVDNIVDADVMTAGDRSAGVMAQSIGGGGGSGGISITATVAIAGVGSGAAGVGVGGFGGDGGDAGSITNRVEGSVVTAGVDASAVIAQSVGGGGGNGGMSIVGTLSGAGVGSGAASVAVGGTGGTGGQSATVDNTVIADVQTAGDRSLGVLAQSVGGGGGNGGIAIAGTASVAGAGSGAGGLGVGGMGGDGGDAADVSNTVEGSVRTAGADASAIVAQSIGGGGGNGGLSVAGTFSGAGAGSGAGSVGVGGVGGGGGISGVVTNTVDAVVETAGANSMGVLAQSIGGGGGNGGIAIAATVSVAGAGSGAGSVGVGGAGGGGGDAGVVDNTVDGMILTRGSTATGVLAQSVGGGGGSGGISIAASVSAAGTGGGSAAVGVGGMGGGGGDAAHVTNSVSGMVTTLGRDSSAVVAQSIGGGGGNGGLTVAGTFSGAGTGSGAVAVGVGGMGGDGGNAGTLNNSVDADVVTSGRDSTGVLAQSVGGGGGNGGIAISAAVSVAGTGSGAASVGIGGAGGGGGTAATVTNTVTGSVTTTGLGSEGIIAQSIGGGGGNGGLTVAGTISGAGTGSGAVALGIGGMGGGGGASDTVQNTVDATVTTEGYAATGVLAQSVGGGGGSGALSVSGAISYGGSGSGAVSVGVGGFAGDGGDAGTVDNGVTGVVWTRGGAAPGVVAQSIGGGGGNGALAVSAAISASKSGGGALSVGVGGAGGGGGQAGTVINDVMGFVQTEGGDAVGILAQSVGGGGGSGGTSISGTFSGAGSGSGAVAIAVGGAGGDGGSGADVTNDVTGGAITTGDRSTAILAQSIGGGGGSGGVSVSGAVSFSKESGGALAIGVGGFGGGGGNAGNVISTVATTEEYTQVGTMGDDASAIIAQSLGGGGGNGGVNVAASVNMAAKNGAAIGIGVGGFGGGGGNAGDVMLDVSGEVVTLGNNSHGLIAQSLGGGGGNGGVNVTGAVNLGREGTGGAASIGFGGFGGSGGNAGNVNLTYRGALQARPQDSDGEGSHGILAQSLGGGGGNGGVNVSASLSYASNKNGGDGHALVVGVGGFGGGGGNAGEVVVNVGEGSSVTSSGNDRSAIFAQSVGGGGGNGAVNVSAGIASDAPIVFGMGGFGGAGGTAGTVTINADADILATGNNARGIFAQSIGGGGGNGGLNVSGAIAFAKEATPPAITIGMGGFGGAGNISGDVYVNQDGSILTSGENAHGIFAQSIAGGGGNGGINVSAALIFADNNDSGGYNDLSIVAGMGGHGGTGADAGDAFVTSDGGIVTEGEYARGIFAQSIGGGGGNGGFNFAGNLVKKSSIITVGVGGFGSGGGDAGIVTVARGSESSAAGLIATNGTGAIGIEATSIGGGGGDAGVNVVASVLLGGSDAETPEPSDPNAPSSPPKQRPHPEHTGVDPEVFTNYDKVLDELEGRKKPDAEDQKDKDEKQSPYAVQLAIGGNGGGAGTGNTASVENHGDIVTSGQQSHGILAQSIGGGGGNATYNVALTYIKKESRNTGINVALGGATGDGGSGGRVVATHEGKIETFGADSHGIIAQSIGGGGGNAGTNMSYSKAEVGKVDISIGRRGGSGGQGGEVTLSSSGSVITHGDRSWGLLAQSIGNGGGNSSAVTISAEVPEEDKTPARGASLSIGLEGGVGGSAGPVRINADGLVVTEGRDAHAIFAQSVGGGGGNGGDAKGKAANAAISIGGTGGSGGTGGTITIVSSADVMTTGTGSMGIIGQSIGGGGGTAGKSEAEIESSEAGLAFSLGGIGGSGASAGSVVVENSGLVVTGGRDAHGILAQSLGGGGGNGTMSVTSIKTKDKEKKEGEQSPDQNQDVAVQVGLAIGGVGGDGGTGSAVRVTNTGGIGTDGVNAAGIFAQSVGGGGGNASQVVSSFEGKGVKIDIGLGADGGIGGTGGNVTVENRIGLDGSVGQIVTTGDNAHGIVAMSIGGGGGTGSTVISKNEGGADIGDVFEEEGPEAAAVSLNIGGVGGMGGTSGLVTVTNDGQIATYGEGAHGIFAMSIGGGGGNGGAAYQEQAGTSVFETPIERNLSIGGQGGSGNASGDVHVINTGSIEMFGDGSYGVFAQSVGGGGGNGGMAGGATPEGDDDDAPNTTLATSIMNFSLGGAGGDGADSGNVTVDHSGGIVSYGDDSYGIYAQSIAGGGGTMGVTYSSLRGSTVDFLLPLIIGSRDGGIGEAGRVEVNTEGDIVMLGASSRPHHVQSVNGGGGDLKVALDVSQSRIDQGQVMTGPDGVEGLFAALLRLAVSIGSSAVENGAGSAISAEHIGDLMSLGNSSTGNSTQSVGGGGGSGTIDLVANEASAIELELLLGGSDSVNSGGGDIALARTGDILSAGDNSGGAAVQSIGGGGGNLIVNVATAAPDEPLPGSALFVAAAKTTPVSPAASVDHAAYGSSASLAMGADGSAGNDGGTVDLLFAGDVRTDGALSPGLLIQSIGGGGGDVRLAGLDLLAVTLGGSNGATGDGGVIVLSNFGNVLTRGALSHGVVLQSIGGGGGSVLTDANADAVSYDLSPANVGSGGDITFSQNGDIVAFGERAVALLVQSLGGGGGILDSLFMGSAGGDGSSGDITLDLDGSATAEGRQGVGVFAQSVGSAGQGDIAITLGEGHFIFGGADGAAVWLSGGNANRLDNFGTIATADGADGTALRSERGTTVIDNYGALIGEIELAPGVQRLTNHTGALFAPGPRVELGDSASLVSSDGLLMPGFLMQARSVALTGSLVQSTSGVTHAEIDFAADVVDQILATGTMDLAGAVDVSLINVRSIPVGSFSKVLFQAEQGLTDSGLAVNTAPSAVVAYDTSISRNAVILNYDIDFVPDGLDRNLEAVADYISRGQEAGGGTADYGNLMARLVSDPDLDAYRGSLSQLSPEIYGAHQVQLVHGAVDFGQRLMSCRQAGGEYRFTREGSCVWAQYDSYDFHTDTHGDYKAIRGSASRASFGAQRALDSGWSFGFGLAREKHSSSGFDRRWSASGHTYHLGLTAKRQYGPTKWSGAMSYGWSDADTRRRLNLLEPGSAGVERDLRVGSAMLRLSHDLEYGDWYVRPMADVGLVHLRGLYAEEHGVGASGLILENDYEFHTWVRPAVEFGREFALGAHGRLRVMFNSGVQQFLGGSSTDVKARLAGARTNVEPMSVATDMGDPVFGGRFGLELLRSNGFVAQLYVSSSRSDETDIDSTVLKLQFPLR